MHQSQQTNPIWLQNCVLGFNCCERVEEQLTDLVLSSHAINRWLDVETVSGNSNNIIVAKEALKLMLSLGDMVELKGFVGAVLDPIRQTTKRLRGLVNGTN